MTDETAKAARLMKVVEVIVAELDRQGVVETLADLGFDPAPLAEAVIKAADGDVVRFPGTAPPEVIERQHSASAPAVLWLLSAKH